MKWLAITVQVIGCVWLWEAGYVVNAVIGAVLWTAVDLAAWRATR